MPSFKQSGLRSVFQALMLKMMFLEKFEFDKWYTNSLTLGNIYILSISDDRECHFKSKTWLKSNRILSLIQKADAQRSLALEVLTNHETYTKLFNQ